MDETSEAQRIDFGLCIVCQAHKKDENLVENPSSHKTFLDAIKQHNEYRNGKLSELWPILKDLPSQGLGKVTWHRTCYQETTHSGMIKRAKARFERAATSPNESRRKSSCTTSSSVQVIDHISNSRRSIA